MRRTQKSCEIHLVQMVQPEPVFGIDAIYHDAIRIVFMENTISLKKIFHLYLCMMNHSKKINHHQIECISLKCVSKYPNVGKGHGFWVRFCFLPITSLYVEVLRCLGHPWEANYQCSLFVSDHSSIPHQRRMTHRMKGPAQKHRKFLVGTTHTGPHTVHVLTLVSTRFGVLRPL